MGATDGRAAIGRSGEDAAAARYVGAGYRVLARNWRCRLGELDLVVERGGTVVFCEVKTRRGSAFGAPFDAVTWAKQRKLRTLAEAFLASYGLDPSRVRFDVASVGLGRSGRPRVEVFEQAF